MKKRKQTTQTFSEHYIPYILTMFYFKPLFYTLDVYKTIILSFVKTIEEPNDRRQKRV